MSDLLHCPFCGGRQTYRKHDGGVWLTTTNHKRGCIMRDALSFVAFNTEAEAIAAWNTRAERTCELINAGEDCGNGIPSLMCFSCGYTAPDEVWCDAHYCPNCGAKVVDE